MQHATIAEWFYTMIFFWGGGLILIQPFIHLRPRSGFIILFCTSVRVEVRLKQAGLRDETYLKKYE